MDLVIILFFLGLLVFGLFIISINSSEKADKKNPTRLHELARENNLNLERAELSSSLLLGLDESSRKLIAIEPRNNEDPLLIDLREYLECQLKTNESDKSGETEFISLNLIHENDEIGSLEIVFYDELDIEKRNRTTQMQMAKRWSRHIGKLIT